MSSQQLYLPFDSTTTANFNAWASGISGQLTTAGWTMTTDTGQVNWTTNPAPPASNIWTLYEIRIPASDPKQTGATAYYLRIDYGQRATGVPCMRLTIGTGTDGAGNLTGYVTANAFTNSNGGGTPTGITAYECDFSWDTSRLAALLWRNMSSSNQGNVEGFAIERTKANDGTDNTDGITLMAFSGGGGATFQQTLVFGIGVAPSFQALAGFDPVPVAGVGNSMIFGNAVPISPIFPCYGKWGNPVTVLGSVYYNDCLEGAFVHTGIYGTSMTYIMTRQICTGPRGGNTALLMRFD